MSCAALLIPLDPESGGIVLTDLEISKVRVPLGVIAIIMSQDRMLRSTRQHFVLKPVMQLFFAEEKKQ